MKIKDLLNKLATYNLEAEFEIYVNDKPAEFEICCGGAEGVTPATCDHVTVFANSTTDNDSSAAVEEAHIVDTTAYCGEFMCSHCDETFKSNRYKYCPWCGAKFNNSEELM